MVWIFRWIYEEHVCFVLSYLAYHGALSSALFCLMSIACLYILDLCVWEAYKKTLLWMNYPACLIICKYGFCWLYFLFHIILSASFYYWLSSPLLLAITLQMLLGNKLSPNFHICLFFSVCLDWRWSTICNS